MKMDLRSALRATNVAQEHVLPDTDHYDPLVCQCYGYRQKPDSVLECVCAGTEWYMLPGGGVECLPHRVVRASGGAKSWWSFKR